MSASLALSLGWAAVAALAPGPLRTGGVAVVALVLAGVPIVGLLTYQHGPWPGLAALGLGAGALLWRAGRTARPDGEVE